MENTIYDISPLLTTETAVYPGDIPLTREFSEKMSSGGLCDTSAIRATTHLGAHADSPSHVVPGARSINELPLSHFLGLCQVIHVAAKKGEVITPAHIEGVELTEQRILIGTSSFSYGHAFDTHYSGLSVELVELLAEKQVITIGVDVPSVDSYGSPRLASHYLAFKSGMVILEGLVLNRVPAGTYELIALPLKLRDFEASPVRAVLRALEA